MPPKPGVKRSRFSVIGCYACGNAIAMMVLFLTECAMTGAVEIIESEEKVSEQVDEAGKLEKQEESTPAKISFEQIDGDPCFLKQFPLVRVA